MLTALVFTACKKDKNDNNGGDGGNNPGTKLITKMTETENGETTVFTFIYDNAKRLSKYGSADGKELTTFTYDAAGNVTKVEYTEEEYKGIYSYTYANGVPVSGTFKGWKKHGGEPDVLIEDDELTYTVANNLVTKIKLYMKQNDAEVEMNFTYANGNLATVESLNEAFPYKATFGFGNKKSPFPQISKYILDQAGFSLLFSSQHELTKAVYDFPGDELDRTTTTTYTYDASGYPLTANDGELQVKYEYQ